MIGRDYQDRIQEQVNAIEKSRLLLGFLNKVEAVQRLKQANSLREPIDPTLDEEDISKVEQDMEEKFEKQWEEANSAIGEPPPFATGLVDIKKLPDDDAIQGYLEEFTSQEHIQNYLERFPEESWEFGLVPIRQLVAYQPSVTISAHEDIPTSEDGILDLLKYTLPMRGTKYIMTQQIASGSFKGFQFISRGPNIDLTNADISRDEETDSLSVTFHIEPNINMVQVTQYNHRFILKNGYHRSFQLLKSGETHVPALVRNVQNFQDTGAQQNGTFSKKVLSDRPPMMADFLTDAAVDIDSAGSNKVIRVIGETTRIRR